MRYHVFSRKCMRAAQLSVAALLVQGMVQGMVQAQTIESQDTRTFQDSRGQDSRQSPVVIPPGETERLKRLTEKATIPEENERSAPSSAPQNSQKESEPPQRGMSPDQRR